MFNSSVSQLIINFAFIYSSIICHFRAIEYFNEKEILMALLLWFCALTSLMGAFRFKIAKIIKKLRKK